MSRSILFILISTLSIPFACTDSDPCGEGQVYSDGACRKNSIQSPGTAGASGADAAASPDGAAGAPSSDFGAACSVHEDCTGPTNYCAKSPFGPAYCTVSGCDADATLCPGGWTCFNVGQFAPGEPYVCAQPM